MCWKLQNFSGCQRKGEESLQWAGTKLQILVMERMKVRHGFWTKRDIFTMFPLPLHVRTKLAF